MLYCVCLLKKPIKKGELQGNCVSDYTDDPFLHFMLFSIWRDWTLPDSEHWLYYKLISSAVYFLFSCENERVYVRVCMHSFALKRATNAQIWWIRSGWSSKLCRALTESFFEMYIQCEGLKWFLLNSIFYRFCRHFVVGRKKNKRNFMGAFLPRFSVSHLHIVRFSNFILAKHETILSLRH